MREAAHDVNNLLAVINGLAERGELDVARGSTEKAVERFATIRACVGDCTRIIKDSFGVGRAPTRPGTFDLNDAVRAVIYQLADDLKQEGMAIEFSRVDQSLLIAGDAMKLKRAVQNLCINARDARRESAAGPKMSIYTFLESATAVLLVTDNGRGADAQELRRRMSELESGSRGYGLKVIYKSVSELGGWIDVESVRGQGTSFRINLPLAK
jgi:C4-dicarboxylate-specific signal transduction histidine kinase